MPWMKKACNHEENMERRQQEYHHLLGGFTVIFSQHDGEKSQDTARAKGDGGAEQQAVLPCLHVCYINDKRQDEYAIKRECVHIICY